MRDSSRDFDWRIYADATCAGLSVLIPIPLLDLAFESFFKRRMPATICRARAVHVDESAISALQRRRRPLLSARGCALLPVVGAIYLLKRLSRKILYFLTIREASEQLSVYWHRAFLLDHMAVNGHLMGSPEAVESARDALESTLETAETSPLMQLARTTVGGAHRVVRLLVRARRKGNDAEVRAQERALEDHWAAVSGHFEGVAVAYDTALAGIVRAGRRTRTSG